MIYCLKCRRYCAFYVKDGKIFCAECGTEIKQNIVKQEVSNVQ